MSGLRVLAPSTLREAVSMLNGEAPRVEPATPLPSAPPDDDLDFDDVRGQSHAKRGLEIAAAGAPQHLLVGPPGGGQPDHQPLLNRARRQAPRAVASSS